MAVVPSWKALCGSKPRAHGNEQKPPLHAKDVVASLDIDKCIHLNQPEATRNALIDAARWLRPGKVYDTIADALAKTTLRRQKTALDADDLAIIFDLRKIVRANSPPLAFCNAFAVIEEKEEGERRRPIFEPLINDILADSTEPILASTTRYTPKEDIRRFVYETECAAQFDFAAWFDQFQLHPEIRKFFGVQTNDGDHVLSVLPMGFRPSCQVAQATTTSIMSVSVDTPSASCVDNVLYLGSKTQVEAAAKEFLQRASQVGALIKDRTITIATEYDFLGEHYDHVKKTRCLTVKTASKARYALDILRTKESFKTKQLQAIFGLLLYAANTLRITVANFHWAMRFLSAVCATPQHETHTVPSDVRAELSEWARQAAENRPVAVHTPDCESDYVIYTDASAYGWGAVSISKGGSVLTISGVWSERDRHEWNLQSSVSAEPLAIRKAIAALVPSSATKVTIFTDHESFVGAFHKGIGRTYAYAAAMQFLSQYKTIFEVRHVPGEHNPADVLSRARQPAPLSTPPLLAVTSVAGQQFRGGGEGRVWEGAGLASGG